MSSSDEEYYTGGAGETAPGVVMLRQLWNIPKRSSSKEVPPDEVNTDIYSTPGGKKPIPIRRRRRD